MSSNTTDSTEKLRCDIDCAAMAVRSYMWAHAHDVMRRNELTTIVMELFLTASDLEHDVTITSSILQRAMIHFATREESRGAQAKKAGSRAYIMCQRAHEACCNAVLIGKFRHPRRVAS